MPSVRDGRGSTGGLTRRHLLGTLGAAGAVALAGCSGGGATAPSGDSGSGDGGGSGTGGSAPPRATEISCADLTARTSTYGGGERPFVVDFDLPSVLAGAATYQGFDGQVTVTSVVPLAADGTEQFHLFVSQITDGTDAPSAALEGAYERVTEVTFGGEARWVGKVAAVDSPAVEQLITHLPYDGGDGRRYYQFLVQLELEGLPTDDVSDACGTAIDEAALGIVTSIRPNPDTTLGT